MDKSGENMRKIVDKTVGCQKSVRSHSGSKLLFTSANFSLLLTSPISIDNSYLIETH